MVRRSRCVLNWGVIGNVLRSVTSPAALSESENEDSLLRRNSSRAGPATTYWERMVRREGGLLYKHHTTQSQGRNRERLSSLGGGNKHQSADTRLVHAMGSYNPKVGVDAIF